MRNFILLTVFATTVLFTSCDLDGESNYTPNVFFLRMPTNQYGDSLLSYMTDKPSVYRLDTINVGDTISFYVYLEAYSNQLTAFFLNQSADSVSRIILPSKASMDSVFTPLSDYRAGKFIMEGTMSTLFFPFQYVAKKPSKEAKLEFIVTSNANFDGGFASNTNGFQLKTPIRAVVPVVE
ncbi:MAG: hypothetical protein RBT57_04285 [Paludibacter sp.]|jgi:hypothetical protein|nr:hypothetical protein [Paludibacter sp.]